MFADSYPRLKQFSPIECCMYCRSTADLTKEHVVPLGIAGHSMVLERASCRDCARRTSQLESAVLEGGLRILRQKYNSPTRHKNRRKGLIKTHLARSNEDGEWVHQENIVVGIDQIPAVCVLPELNAPRIFASADASPGWTGSFWFWQEEMALPTLNSSIAGRGGLHVAEVNPTLFARFLAKIAHGYAVAHLGMDGFRPYLPPVILRDTEDPFRYVGGYLEPPPNPGALHQVTQGYAEINGAKYVLVRIRLFALLGAPEYVVVAGDCDLAI